MPEFLRLFLAFWSLGRLWIQPGFCISKIRPEPPKASEGLRGQTRREFGQLCRVTHNFAIAQICARQNPGLPRKAGKSPSDLPRDFRLSAEANFAIAKFGLKIRRYSKEATLSKESRN